MAIGKIKPVSILVGAVLASIIFTLMGATAKNIPKPVDGSTLPLFANPDLGLMSILASGAETGGPGIITGNPGESGAIIFSAGGVSVTNIMTVVNLGDADIKFERFRDNVFNLDLGVVEAGRTETIAFSFSGATVSEIRFTFVGGTAGKFAFVNRPNL